ncbi:MAG TPA: FG-GAP-like repeat-containing protein [Cyclobacteriaceae bacterium]|nr:FG-GAP-like repeat-containing protein [Cyclobacteriaceae bacterium]
MKRSKQVLYLFISLLTLCQFPLLAQVPFIKSVSKPSGKAQETVTIQGINFGTLSSNIKVTFGGVSSVPQTISDQLIEVNVPFGTGHDEIQVINTSLGLMGYSKDPFFQSYGGINPFNVSQLSTQSDFNSESALYDLTTADFDGDGKQDVATANNGSTNISVFLNTGSPGTISFTKSLLTPNVNTLHVTSADLNGDGKPEILVTELNGSRVFIFKNNSTPGSLSFGAPTSITIPGSKVSSIVIRDVDFNGKPDLIASDQAASRVFVSPNTSTLATIQFGTASGFLLGGASVTDGLAVGDLDGDGLPEIVVSEFLSPTGKLFILKNQSIPGTLNFSSPYVITTSITTAALHIGDLDGDGKPELASTALLTSGVMIFRNQCTSTKIQFASPVFVAVDQKPWGIDFGDMDGDGKPDIAAACIGDKAITILNNKSTAGSFSFQKQTVSTTYISRYVKINDIDNDGRPDLNFASIDDNNLGILASKISVILNKNCVIPTLSPAGPLSVCVGLTPHQLITASSNPGGTYEWFKDTGSGAVSLGAPSASNTVDVNVNGTGTYTAKLVNGGCINTTATGVAVTILAGTAPAVTPNPVAPVCLGGTLSLSVSDVGASDYVWSGPDSFTAHGFAVARPGFQSIDAGKYTVEVMVGPCVVQRASLVVDVVDVPNATVTYSGSDVLCQGQSKVFSVFPTLVGYTYQWAEQTKGDIAGATLPTYTATVGGDYFVKLKSTANTTCAPISSTSKKVRIAAIPFVDFLSPSAGCVGQVITFTDQSVLDSDTTGLHVRYSWNFGDAGTSNLQNPTHTYAAAQTFTVNLTVAYINNSCPASKAKPLPVKAAPKVEITNPSQVFSVCASDSLLLQVLGNFDTYLWSTGDKTSSIYVNKAGTYSVDVTSGACQLNDDQVVGQFSAPAVTATAKPTSIKVGESSELNATGLTTYLWRPNKSNLSDSLISNPVASPVVSTTYTVSGKDTNGCTGSATVDLLVTQNSILDSLHPSNFFSPNGVPPDETETWKVENIGSFPQCGVTIYDEKGIKVYQAKPYLEDWTGISSGGKVLPAGVYYYVIKCDDSGNDYKAGSINIVR